MQLSDLPDFTPIIWAELLCAILTFDYMTQGKGVRHSRCRGCSGSSEEIAVPGFARRGQGAQSNGLHCIPVRPAPLASS